MQKINNLRARTTLRTSYGRATPEIRKFSCAICPRPAQYLQLYMLIYPAENPIVMGLGYAATRDFDSFLRYQTKDDLGNANPLALDTEHVGIRHVYASGTSQISWYLREFIFLGFNEDEAQRKVFDGVTMFTAGGSQRDGLNIEFADPNTYSLAYSRHDFFATAWAP